MNDFPQMMTSLNSIIKKGGIFVSAKQQAFLLKVLPEQHGFFDPKYAGIERVDGMQYFTVTGDMNWADYGRRGFRQYGFVYEMDTYGVVRQWKLHWTVYKDGSGSAINPKRTELVFTREKDVDVSHLMVEEKAKAESTSNYIGSIKDKVQIRVKLVYRTVRSYQMGWNTVVTDLLIMEEIGTGNKVVWSSSKEQPIENGTEFTISGTVKAHSTYREEKQTILTRCKVVL